MPQIRLRILSYSLASILRPGQFCQIERPAGIGGPQSQMMRDRAGDQLDAAFACWRFATIVANLLAYVGAMIDSDHDLVTASARHEIYTLPLVLATLRRVGQLRPGRPRR